MTLVSRRPVTAPPAGSPAAPVGKAAARTGRVLSSVIVLFLLADSVTKLLRVPAVVDATVGMGFPAHTVPVIGAVLLGCLVLHVVPRTAVLGAVLLTGYLGGAVCAQLRIEAPLLSTQLSAVYAGVIVWVGLYLRSNALRALVRAGS